MPLAVDSRAIGSKMMQCGMSTVQFRRRRRSRLSGAIHVCSGTAQSMVESLCLCSTEAQGLGALQCYVLTELVDLHEAVCRIWRRLHEHCDVYGPCS